ncbi:MAG: hypothetical protein ACI8XG_000342 [Congregibacter sp.]
MRCERDRDTNWGVRLHNVTWYIKGMPMSSKTVLKNEGGDVTLPNFFNRGFDVVLDGADVYMNLPGFAELSDLKAEDINAAGYKISQFLLTHYHPEASHTKSLVLEFQSELVAPTLLQGGRIPNETIKDWLFYHGKKSDLVGEQ